MECSINYATKRSHENVLRFGCFLLLRATFESLVSHTARYAPFSTFNLHYSHCSFTKDINGSASA